jgi:hypothetical protein
MAGAKKHESFAAAIAAAQANMSNAIKNAKNPHFKSNYADLAAVRDVALPAFNAEGIAVLQAVDGHDGWITVSTSLLWGSERIEVGRCSLPLGEPRNLKHETGSISTYLRRYQLASVAQIAQVDDDGNGQGHNVPPKTRQPTKAQRLAQEQLAKVKQILHKEVGCAGEEDADAVIRWATGGCWSLKTMSQDPGDVLSALQEKNDSGTPYEFMRERADEVARLEAKR